MSFIDVKADFTKSVGKINPKLHSSNAAPNLSNRGISNQTAMFERMHFYSSRTHDWALWNAGERMVDTHFVFPLMHLDPADPRNYYFAPTDEMIDGAREAGMKVFYRMGTSIEHSGKRHFNTLPVEDYEKYAEVLAGIVRHYTQGWADGFHYDMEYWEIWNEPDCGPVMWNETLDDFIRFFVIVYKRLKKEFPELKFGGPAQCWFNQEFFSKLCDACKAAGFEPDFISWHCYTNDADNLIEQPAAARKFLDDRGFKNTEIIINEWHFITSWWGLHHHVTQQRFEHNILGDVSMFGIESAAFNLAVLCGWQATPLDQGFYYGAAPYGTWGWYTPTRALNKNYYSMVMFGDVTANYTERMESQAVSMNFYSLAALSEDGKKGCLLVVDYGGDNSTVAVKLNTAVKPQNITVLALDSKRDMVPAEFVVNGDEITIVKVQPGSAAFSVKFDL